MPIWPLEVEAIGSLVFTIAADVVAADADDTLEDEVVGNLIKFPAELAELDGWGEKVAMSTSLDEVLEEPLNAEVEDDK